MTPTTVPNRQIRAVYGEATITVYQAYSPAIALPALAANRFRPPFRQNRMTWIKPSFLWMAYRSGWGSKPGQEYVLAIEVTREGFEWALANACLSHYDARFHESHERWMRSLESSPVRIQWDPERDLRLDRLDHRSIQIGLSDTAISQYVDDWTVSISDMTQGFKTIHKLVEAGELEEASSLLPQERPYPLSSELSRSLGMN